MSPVKVGSTFAVTRWKATVVLLSLGFALLCGRSPGAGAAGGALTFFKNYFVTGDYVVGGVGLRGQGVNGLATGSITIAGVPADADIVAAFLYWQVVTTDTAGPDSGSLPVDVQGGNPLRSADGPFGKVLDHRLGTAPCWSSGGGTGSSGGSKQDLHLPRRRPQVLRRRSGDREARRQRRAPGQRAGLGLDGNTTPMALGASLVVDLPRPDPGR